MEKLIRKRYHNFSFVLFRYAALAPLYYRGAAVAVLVYDITSPESFAKAQYWVKVYPTAHAPILNSGLFWHF